MPSLETTQPLNESARDARNQAGENLSIRQRSVFRGLTESVKTEHQSAHALIELAITHIKTLTADAENYQKKQRYLPFIAVTLATSLLCLSPLFTFSLFALIPVLIVSLGIILSAIYDLHTIEQHHQSIRKASDTTCQALQNLRPMDSMFSQPAPHEPLIRRQPMQKPAAPTVPVMAPPSHTQK